MDYTSKENEIFQESLIRSQYYTYCARIVKFSLLKPN